MNYKNPTLNEILSKIYLEKNNLTTDKFFELVPNIKKSGLTRIEFLPSMEPLEQVILPQIRCWNDDKTLLVQLLPDTLIVNQIGGYLGWDKFKEFFNKYHNLLKEVLSGQVRYRSLSLTTIDKFAAPKQNFYLGKYLNCGGNKIPEWYRDAKEALDITLGRGFLEEDNVNRQIEVKVRKQQDSFLINISSVFHNKIIGNDKQIDQILDKLHVESNESFESIVTDITRNEIMGGLK